MRCILQTTNKKLNTDDFGPNVFHEMLNSIWDTSKKNAANRNATDLTAGHVNNVNQSADCFSFNIYWDLFSFSFSFRRMFNNFSISPSMGVCFSRLPSISLSIPFCTCCWFNQCTFVNHIDTYRVLCSALTCSCFFGTICNNAHCKLTYIHIYGMKFQSTSEMQTNLELKKLIECNMASTKQTCKSLHI